MTASTDNKYQEDNFKLYGRAHQVKNNDLKYFATIRGGRICCSTKDDNKKRVKPRFSGVSASYKATTVRCTAAAAASTVTPTSSSTRNEQTENTFYAFSYYQITSQDINCSCYVCTDLAVFKPKQNDAIVVVGGFAVSAKKQSKRRRTYV